MPGASKLMINLCDGTRCALPAETEALITLHDGRRQLYRDYRTGTSIPFELDSPTDLRVVVSVSGYRQAGFFPVPLKANTWTTLDLMLLKRGGDFNFSTATWLKLPDAWQTFLGPRTSYEETLEARPRALATMLNVLTATDLLGLLTHFREIEWSAIRNDRFFAWVDPEFVFEITQSPRFASAPKTLHKGATRSFKQIEFNEANLQYSLHEDAKAPETHPGCIRVECDMDYYKNRGAHTLLEVLPNQLTGTKTNPAVVYMLRWMAGKRFGEPDFAPPYQFG